MLSLDVSRRLDEDGFAVVPAFKSRAETAALRRRAEELVAACDERERAIFTTRDESTKNDDYFLTSGETIRCFFEEEAFDGAGALCRPKAQAINKIGHAMHDLDPVFSFFSSDPRLQEIAHAAGLREPRVYQSMYIFKQPGIGGEVRWHQDATYFYTEPLSVTGFWFAIDDAGCDNGCMWVEPGAHRSPLRERFVVDSAGARVLHLDATPWPSLDRAVPLEVEEGTLVVFTGLLPHYSAANRSSRSRHAYTLHAVDDVCAYPATNWLQRSAAFPARGFV